MKQRSGIFTPNAACMETCATFAGAGQEWEMSGDSANCRMQFFLMAHRRGPESGESSPKKLEDLCLNAHPFDTEMCQGSTFGDYYTTRETQPCRELCYNDRLTCGSSYGTPEECLKTCSLLPKTGQRQDTQGNSVYCRLSWAQYAFFVGAEDPLRQAFCDFARAKSAICVDPGNRKGGKGAVLPPQVQEALSGH